MHNACFTEAQQEVIAAARQAHITGISEFDAWMLWNEALMRGFIPRGRFRKPQFDSYQNGKVYHMKINGYHINIY